VRVAWRLRLGAGILVLAGLGFRAFQGPGVAEGLLLAASGLITAHLLIGVWVFVCRLRALSRRHQVADALAFLCLGGAVVCTGRTPLWCLCFAGLFAVALWKYRLCAGDTGLAPAWRSYAREKIRLERPTVPVFGLAGGVTALAPGDHAVQWLVPAGLAAGVLSFGVDLILVRRMYRFEPYDIG
jgi:hypothetical protein